MIKFCSECGLKVEYKFSPPKFCSQCGSPMGIATANESKPLSRNVTASRRIEAISDDETDADHVPQLNKLEYEVDTFGSQYNQTIGSLAGKSAPSIRRKNVRHIDDLG